jgi:hypothetical protein
MAQLGEEWSSFGVEARQGRCMPSRSMAGPGVRLRIQVLR